MLSNRFADVAAGLEDMFFRLCGPCSGEHSKYSNRFGDLVAGLGEIVFQI